MNNNSLKVCLISLGCDKNLVDSEHISGILADKGYQLCDDEAVADVIIINSCCFIHDAKEESINMIFEMAQYKETGNLKALVLCGCLAQRYSEEIKEEVPEVDICIGTSAYEDIIKALDEFFEKHNVVQVLKDIDYLAGVDKPRYITPYSSYAYLKIAEGCDKHCSYCIIPKIRGNFRSVPMEDLIKEANQIAQKGIKELVLVAQETTMYGTDIYGKKSLHILLSKLSQIEGIKWIRVLYCYPEEIYDELIDEMAQNEKVCNYLDIPIQHASDIILKRMGRRTSNAELRTIIGKLRSKIPDIVLRTSLITGFPGETPEDHKCLLDFVKDIQFDRLGVFTYSQEEGTPAAQFDNQVDEEIKEQRRDEIMTLQQSIVFDKTNDYVGKEVVAIIEGKLPNEDVYLARTYMDAPDVDSNIFVNSRADLLTGELVRVKVTAAKDYDLVGDITKRLEV